MPGVGSTPGIIVGVGVGAAASTAITPALEIPKQEAWKRNHVRLLPTATLAALIAQGGVPLGKDQYDEAHREGFSDDKLDALVYLAQTVPGFAEALTLWRRNPDAFADLWTHALVKNGIDARYLPYLNQLKDDRLSPPVVALAIVRGIIKDPGFLPVGPPTTEGKVKAFPTSPLDGLKEAAAFGFNPDRLFVQTAISGRPMGPESAAHAVFREIIERVDYDRAIAEGDVRNEWADAIFEAARVIPSPSNFVQWHLRGWVDAQTMNKGTARHGMSEADTNVLFEIAGRPLSWHQVFIGIRRGGVYNGPIADIHPAFLKALRESDIRPEWYNLAWAQRFTYPTAFVLRSLTESGDITQARAEEILLFEGWEPELAKTVSEKWAQQAGGTASDPHVAKAQQQLWTAIHRDYTKGKITQADAESALTMIVPDATERAQVFLYWDEELALANATPPA